MDKVIIEKDGQTIELIGRVTLSSREVDTWSQSTIDGETFVGRTGTGTYKVTIDYVNGPLDVPDNNSEP
jgi:hypothetical protein